MNEHEAYEIIMKQLCTETVQIAEQIKKNGSMSVQDLEKIDKIYHAKKSMLTAEAMEEANDYEGGMSGTRMTYSGRRGRGSDGRYVSRDAGENYAEGYDRGYSEAMSRMQNSNNSGHYPMPYYPTRW